MGSPVEDGPAIRTEQMSQTDLFSAFGLVAQPTGEHRSESCLAPFGSFYPWAHLEGRTMSNVLVVAT